MTKEVKNTTAKKEDEEGEMGEMLGNCEGLGFLFAPFFSFGFLW